METVKAPISERVATKVMPLTKWFVEQYFQTYELMSSDSRFKKLPAYNQTSCIATVIIATNNALDKSRMLKNLQKHYKILVKQLKKGKL
jgi:hypothetical protein